MSNQSTSGFQGSQPFISDKEYKSLSLDQLKYILNQKKQGLKDEYKKLSEKEKMIRDIRKVDKLNKKVKQGIDIKKERKEKLKNKKIKKIKSFDEYFQECIENKQFPADTPPYFREALERAIKEYHQGLVKEKSALDDFAVKYIIEGIPGILPVAFFNRIYKTLEDFFTNHRNIKFSMVLVCKMEQQILSKDKGVVGLNQDKAYFKSKTYINLKSTDVNDLINRCINNIIEQLEEYQKNGSGWYFNEVVQIEIHVVDYNPAKGSSYIPLPDWISNKKAIVNIQNKDENAFFGVYLDIFTH